MKISVKRDVTAKVDVSLLSKKRLSGSCEKREFTKGQEFEIFNFTYSSIMNLLPNGEMTVVCDITMYGKNKVTVESISENMKALPGKSHNQFRESFMELLNSKEMSDVQIKCADQTFNAHQFVLSVRSPVFRNMFQARMKEKDSG